MQRASSAPPPPSLPRKPQPPPVEHEEEFRRDWEAEIEGQMPAVEARFQAELAKLEREAAIED